MKSERVRLFQTLPHPCGYYSGRTAQNLVIDPAAPDLAQLYGLALERGFRRAGSHLYLPQCPHCHACTPCRIDTVLFQPNRGQHRCLQRNDDLEVHDCEPGYTLERHALYRRYLRARHSGGGMDEGAASDFERFLCAAWSPTHFLEIRHRARLLAVAVTDVNPTGLSAVYTFFEPDETRRSLGTYAILQQIEHARSLDIPWLYLGFWIAGHPKMDYKKNYTGLQIRTAAGWVIVED